MEHAAKGQAALDASDGLTAASHFTRALIEHPTSPDYFTLRSTAFTRLKPPRHDLALRDAEYAVLLGQRRQKREKIQAAQQRRVVALYGLGRYEEAKTILESMLKWRGKDVKKDKMEHDMWMAKIMSKLKGKDAEGQSTESVKEYPEIKLPDDKKMVTWLKNHLKNDGSFKFDDEEDLTIAPTPSMGKEKSHTTFTADEKELEAAKLEAPAEPAKPKIQPIRQDWYQDNNSVTITLYAKKVDPTKLSSHFASDSVHLSFPHPDAADETFSLTLDPTCKSIDPDTSIAKATGAKVEVKLMKKDKGIKWSALDDKSRPKTDKLPSAWTTKGDQDWDKKAANLTKKEPKKKVKKDNEENSEGEGDAASDAESDPGGDQVDDFFKKLYAGADDDTRRAMMKSFQESNGTALSTNWSEVSKGKVEEVKSKDD